MNATSDTPRKRGWMFKLGIVFAILVVLLVVAYFVVTSSAFLTGVILPRVGKAMNAEVTVSSASIHPWSEVVLQNFKVKPNGRETLVTAEQVHARYSLWDIIRGKIVVQEASLTSPVVTYVENADGSSNVDPLKRQGEQKQQPESKPGPQKPSTPPQVDIRNISMKNARVDITKNLKDGGRQVIQVTGFDMALDQIQNGQPAKLTYGGELTYEAKTNQAAVTDVLAAKINGNFAIKFSNDLNPETLNGTSRVDVTKTGGSLNDLAGLATVLDCDATTTDIRKISLHFDQSGNTLGELRISGPFAIATSEGRLKVELLQVDRRLLNLVGGPKGMDFNKSSVNSTNEVELKQKGALVNVNGQFNIVDFSVTDKTKNTTTPTLNLQAAYQVAVDQNAKSALIQKLDLSGTENQKKFLQGNLSKPMPVSWGTGSGMPEEAAMDLVITNFNLADWQSFAADLAPTGLLNSTMHVVSRQGGKQIAVDVASRLSDFGARFGSNQISRLTIDLNTSSQVKNNELQIKKLTGSLAQAGQPAGSFDVGGNLNLTSKVGQVSVKANDINQNLLRPFLADALAGKELVSVSINANANVAMQAGGANSVQGDVGITNLVVRPTGQTSAPKPLSAQFKLDAAMAGQKLDLKQFQILLSPTDRAKNQIDIKGQVDTSKTNAMVANIAVNADSIDVTPFYDLYSGGTKPAEAKPAAQAGKPAPTTAQAAAPTEPEPMQLPIQQAVANLNIGRFYLRQIEITNWVGTVKIEGSHVTVNPFQLALNGAPIKTTADINVGVKGYTYQVSLSMDKVPLEPLANSFMTNTPGAYKGLILADASIKGAGVTGANLKKNLQGNVSFSLTNATIQLTNGILPGFLTPIATALRVPELTADPLNSISSSMVIGQGKINVQTFNLKSAAFVADTHGEIQIADVLTNSPLALPMTFSLKQSLAKKVQFLAQSAPANSEYVQLPDFVKVGGTLGSPKPQINISVTAAGTAILKGIGGQVGNTNTQNILKGLGGILGGQSNPAPSTNAPAPATNAAPVVNDLINIFKKK